MIALLVALFLVAGTGLGWYAHRAWLRIDAWGRNMNDQDAIVRLDSMGEASQQESYGALDRIHVLKFSEPDAQGRGSLPIHPDTIAAK